MVNDEQYGTRMPKVGRYDFIAEPFHCDFNDSLFIGHLGNTMLNAADFHSNERGYGMHYLNTINKTWVLSRLAIEMTQMPTAYEKYSVETWVDAVVRYFTSRNFAVVGSEDNRVYGYGKSMWAMIDTQTRQPVDISAVRDGLIQSYTDTEKACPIEKSGRAKMSDNLKLVRSIETYYSDIDLNGHVNSVKYVEHVLNLFDLDWFRRHRLNRLDIAYVAESYQGDRLNFYREETASYEYAIRVTKGRDEETEVVRAILRFDEK